MAWANAALHISINTEIGSTFALPLSMTWNGMESVRPDDLLVLLLLCGWNKEIVPDDKCMRGYGRALW